MSIDTLTKKKKKMCYVDGRIDCVGWLHLVSAFDVL